MLLDGSVLETGANCLPAAVISNVLQNVIFFTSFTSAGQLKAVDNITVALLRPHVHCLQRSMQTMQNVLHAKFYGVDLLGAFFKHYYGFPKCIYSIRAHNFPPVKFVVLVVLLKI